MMERQFRRIYRGVYVPPDVTLVPMVKFHGAIKRAGPGAAISGMSAAILHGSRWFDDEFEVEICRNAMGQGRNRGGLRVIRCTLDPGDLTEVNGLPVTTVIRTAYDIGRRPPEWRALGHLDDLVRATGLDVGELWRYIVRHPDMRGVRQIRGLVAHIDPVSESPPESWLRLLIVRDGLPQPESQISLFDDNGHEYARFDLGYRKYRIGIEFDGEEFHSTRDQRAHDESRDARARRAGWEILRVRSGRLREDPSGIADDLRGLMYERGFGRD
jgi:hypothetical protein